MDPDFENDILAAISCGLWMISVASLAIGSRFELERHTDFFLVYFTINIASVICISCTGLGYELVGVNCVNECPGISQNSLVKSCNLSRAARGAVWNPLCNNLKVIAVLLAVQAPFSIFLGGKFEEMFTWF